MTSSTPHGSSEPARTSSEEQFVTVDDGTEICYQTFGGTAGDAEPLLLVMGLGGPMTWWDADFCELLARRGFLVIRYDNRDTGRSTKIPVPVSRLDLVRAFLGQPVRAPYSLSRMAQDAVGLLDHLGIERAHVTGVSMGGMIAQTLAIEHPDRVASLVSIMSTTGHRRVGFQHPILLPALIRPRGGGRPVYVRSSAAFWQLIGSPDYPTPREMTVARAEETWDRGFSGSGVLRHALAVLTQPNRTPWLGEVSVPATVIHGLADKMVHVSGGRATARALRGSELLLVKGMGHDLPEGLWEQVAAAIRRTADRAAGPRA